MDAYICSTFYHVLISILKAIKSDERNDIYILDIIENGESLSNRIENSGFFRKVVYLKTPDYVKNKNLLQKLFWQKYGKKQFERKFCVDFRKYRSRYIFMDDTWIAKYFKIEKIQYSLIEDSLDSFKYILNTVYSRLYDRRLNATIIKVIWRIFPYAEGNYKYFLDCDLVKTIEVNDKANIVFSEHARIIEEPRKLLFDQLKEKQNLENVLNIFLDDRNILEGENLAIIFTSPFYLDKKVKSEREQIELYEKIINSYHNEYKILVKPHPRDEVDYSVISNVGVISKSFPSELIHYLDDNRIKKYISIESHCVDIYPKEKVDFYELEEVLTR